MDCKYGVHVYQPFHEETQSWSFSEMLDWLRANGIKKFRAPAIPMQRWNNGSGVAWNYLDKNLRESDQGLKAMWRFAEKKDAVAFKLAWGGE